MIRWTTIQLIRTGNITITAPIQGSRNFGGTLTNLEIGSTYRVIAKADFMSSWSYWNAWTAGTTTATGNFIFGSLSRDFAPGDRLDAELQVQVNGTWYTIDSAVVFVESPPQTNTPRGGSGMYYMRARWYDPTTARFITQDPIRDGMNWYIYANNNPIRFHDPSGLSAQSNVDSAYNAWQAGFITKDQYESNRAMNGNLQPTAFTTQANTSFATSNLRANGGAPTAMEAAMMADHIYNHSMSNSLGDRIVAGWRLINVWFGQDSLKMGIYIRDDDDWRNPSAFSVVFRGSANIRNWINNAQAYLNDRSQDMRDAINFAQGFVASHGSSNITFVGHSKGGGEAIAAATATGRNAITFNAANFSFANYGLSSNRNSTITNYYVDGDILTSTIGNPSIGTAVQLPRQHRARFGTGTIGAVNAGINNHQMSAVLSALRS